ncbi:MAG TPA: ATP-binding protein [Fimbriimonas sp.]|nr:ATP-binding protein [Fimbriimonas sp.]
MISGSTKVEVGPVEAEQNRLDALQTYNVLAELNGPEYRELADLAKVALRAPIAAITVVTFDKAWYRASGDESILAVPREESMCNLILEQPNEPLVVPDLTKHPLFCDHPMIVGPPFFRSYLGVPLKTADGVTLGGMCVADYEPREFGGDDIRTLGQLARQAANLLQLRKAVEDLEIAKKEASQATRAKNAFLANMSHEVRTPMNGIIGLTELLKSTPLDSTQEKFVAGIDTSAKNLMSLLSDVLEYSDLLADRSRLNVQETNLHDMAKELDAMLKPAATARGLRLTAFASHALPLTISADRLRIKQILLHLLDNAIKFTLEGSVELQIKPNGEAIRFSVRDTGIGIPDDLHSYVLAPFGMANESSERPYAGKGLGLSTANELLRLMDSELHMESKVGRGTTFWFDLPSQSHS